jgi:uncharacterized protein YbbC (DUF1343 family)
MFSFGLLLVLAHGLPLGGERAVPPPPTEAIARVQPGLESLLADSLHLVRGRRVGLITNHTGIDAAGVSSIDRLFRHPEVNLVALYAPEHGIRGTIEAGERVDFARDAETGLPIHSLYGATQRPTPEMLEGIDVLLFDILDIGTRYYTYIYTLGLAMEAAGEAGIPFIVLDRPNVIGGALVQGNVLDPAFSSFIGLYPLPMRHGMTPGELARFYRNALGISVDLRVAPLRGWTRSMGFGETGLPWRRPSPSMPSEESALHYPGTCLFEGTPLSVGRGTDHAFQQVGAPWIDAEAWKAALDARAFPGVAFEVVRFTPQAPGDEKFPGTELPGIRLQVTDPALYDPTEVGVAMVIEARRLSGDRWRWRADHFDRLAGTDQLRLGIEAGAEVDMPRAGWEAQRARFELDRTPALLYP